LEGQQIEYRENIVKTLDDIATIFKIWFTDPSDGLFKMEDGENNAHREIFKRYGIKGAASTQRT
jgi:hypothetical protein